LPSATRLHAFVNVAFSRRASYLPDDVPAIAVDAALKLAFEATQRLEGAADSLADGLDILASRRVSQSGRAQTGIQRARQMVASPVDDRVETRIYRQSAFEAIFLVTIRPNEKTRGSK
jgi:hypothetical protein